MHAHPSTAIRHGLWTRSNLLLCVYGGGGWPRRSYPGGDLPWSYLSQVTQGDSCLAMVGYRYHACKVDSKCAHNGTAMVLVLCARMHGVLSVALSREVHAFACTAFRPQTCGMLPVVTWCNGNPIAGHP